MSISRTSARRAALAVSGAAAALVLAACGSGAGHEGHHEKPAASANRAYKADAAFATGMIPHHRQAVAMAELASSRADSREVKELAETIGAAQRPEIETMSGWLRSWGEKVPAEEGGMHHSAGGHDGGMPGMMTGQQMDRLRKASGADFDGKFLDMMVEHHEGAVRMARAEQKSGAYAPARKLAGKIITDQESEIERMNALLGKG